MQAMVALNYSGFYGESDHDVIKIEDPKSTTRTTPFMTVTNVHMCCKGCIKAAEEALAEVEGIGEFEIEEGDTKFTVKGTDMKPQDVMNALRKAGFGGNWR